MIPHWVLRLPLIGLLAVVSVLGLPGHAGSAPAAIGAHAELAPAATSPEPAALCFQSRTAPVSGHAVFLPKAFGAEDDESLLATAYSPVFVGPMGANLRAATDRVWLAIARAFLIPYETGPPAA